MTLAPVSAKVLAPNGRLAVFEALENNWYEGSRWSPNRSWIWTPVQDAKRDLDRFTRYELMKRARYLWKNSPLIRGLIERLVNLTVGNGIHPVPTSSSPEWNKKAKAAWRRFSQFPCVDSRMTMSQYQRIKCRERFLDGEGFTVLTYSTDTGRDRIQGIESDRVTGANADTQSSSENQTEQNVDGVLLNKQGRPMFYKFRNVDKPYSADAIVHHYTPVRSGQYRGEPILASAINTAQDIDDILALEKMGVKDASSHRDIIETASGELSAESERNMRFGTSGFPTTISLPIDDKAKNDYYKVIFQGAPVVLRRGDKYTPYKSERPGSAWQGFMDFLSQSVCLSTGLPPSVLLEMNVGGTDIRRDLEIAQRVISPWQHDIAGEFQRIWEYYIGGEIDDGPLMDAPQDWTNVRWYFPKNMTVDRGRDGQNDRNDVQAGLMSHEEYHGRYSEDWEEYDQAVIKEVAKRKAWIEAAGFESVLEYVQLLSLDSKLFVSRITEDVTPQEEDLNPPKPSPGKPTTRSKARGGKTRQTSSRGA
jgi:capsid protein